MQPDCLEEDIIRNAIIDVDEVYKIEGLAFYTKEWGVKSPSSLSNGIKALILCYYNAMGVYKRKVANCCMGANVGPYLRELSLKYDFDISWEYFLDLGWEEEISVKDADTGKILTTAKDVIKFYAGRWGKYE